MTNSAIDFFETASTPKVFTAIQVSFMEVGNWGSIATHTPLIGYFCAVAGNESRIRPIKRPTEGTPPIREWLAISLLTALAKKGPTSSSPQRQYNTTIPKIAEFNGPYLLRSGAIPTKSEAMIPTSLYRLCRSLS